ncbi:MAG: hypothetical protein AAF554_16940, partial [Bacteroidota bacterium]
KVASNRVQKTLDTLDSLAKCSNRNNYEYNKEDVDKMISVLRSKLKFVENSFRQNIEKGNNKFNF